MPASRNRARVSIAKEGASRAAQRLSLRQTQRWFFQAIAPSETISASTEKRGQAARALSSALTPPRSISAKRALGIYGQMYLLRADEALAETFPALAVYKGPAKFRVFVGKYVRAHPSRHPSLRYFGESVPRFLRNGRLAEGEALSDLARLEWARMAAFDATDEQPLSLAELQSCPADVLLEMNFRLAKAHTLLRLRHDVLPFWRALIGPQNPSDSPERSDNSARQPRSPRTPLPRCRVTLVSVWRRGQAVLHREVEPLEARLLPLLSRGATFEQLAARLATSVASSDLAAMVHRLLATLINEGAIVV